MITKSNTERGIKYPETLTSLKEKLGQKAKREPKFRFYSLYGHLLRKDVLEQGLVQISKQRYA